MITSGHFKTFPNIPSWEDCGRMCQQNSNCNSWSWNVPDNACSSTGCKECVLSKESVKISNTKLEKSWISGLKSCVISIGTTHHGCKGKPHLTITSIHILKSL